MAEVDTRVETLEDEIKVLKGEIRRTLVDLRALLMRENSPLNERTIASMSPPQNAEAPGEPALTRTEVSEMLRQESAESARPTAPDSQPQSPPPGPNPSQSVPQGPGMMGQVTAFAGMPPIQNPMWAAGSMSAPPAAPTPVAPSPDPAYAERERRLADQERRMEEQDRRLADQERNIAAAARREDVRERNDLERPAAGPLAPDPALVERERRLADQERGIEEQERRLADQERNIASATRRRTSNSTMM